MQTKFLYQSIVVLILLIIAFWWGEGGGGIDAIISACIAAALVSLIVFFTQSRFVFKVLTYLCLSVLLVGTFLFGQASNGRAFNECVEHGGGVRALLHAYFQKNHNYPPTLSMLINVPCSRILRPSILDYQLTKQGYQLYFGDAFVSFTATESQPFEARK